MIRLVARQASGPWLAALAPLALLVACGVTFASATLGVSLPAFDDHPGQLYRLWHVVRLGPAPWAWNWGWWAGYPELQFYPPGLAYAGALMHVMSLGVVTVAGNACFGVYADPVTLPDVDELGDDLDAALDELVALV